MTFKVMISIKKFSLSSLLMMLFLCFGASNAQAQDETLVTFFSENATMEDDPNNRNYNITIYSPDDQWKIQLNYYADSMFGTFGNDDFMLSTTGKYYNYARNPHNDMVFYSFTDMNVTVTDEGEYIHVSADCVAKGKYHFVVEANIGSPHATETVSDNLGYARVTPNSFYGTYVINAENDNYKLAYGIVSESLVGTFYRADILLPELTDKKTGQEIEVISATAVHTQEGETTNMVIDILSKDLIMYHLTMYNGPAEIEVKEERTIEIPSGIMQDLSQYYGCWQFAGQTADYAVSLAVTPDVMESGKTEWTTSDFFLPYTQIIALADNSTEDIANINATVERNDEAVVIKADALCMSGVLYHITMSLPYDGGLPPVSETVNIDFGRVVVLDYSKGMDVIGVGAAIPNQCQMRFYFNGHDLEGRLSNDDFILDLCDVMVVNDGVYSFKDASYVKAKMEKEGERINITVDMVCVNDVNYHATMYLEDMKCLHDATYSLSPDDDVMMIALAEAAGDGTCDYTVQFQQNAEFVYDDEGLIAEDGAVFSFSFNQKEGSITGEYGYSAGTLSDGGYYHQIFEKGCEVRVAPVAGTLNIQPVEKVTIDFDGDYTTWVYNVNFQFVGTNGVIYKGEGENILLCINDDGDFITLDESEYTRIEQHLAEKGYNNVRKVVRNGKIVILAGDKTYDLNGARQ